MKIFRSIGRYSLLIAAAVLPAASQSARPARTFEVASVRPHEGPIPREGGSFSISGPRISMTCYRVRGLILFAYNLKPYQVASAGMDPTFYDLAAKAEDGLTPSRDEFRVMMQGLLADRFHLRIRRETRQAPVYALIAGDRPKLTSSDPGDTAPRIRFEVAGRGYTASMREATMDDLTGMIGENVGLDRPVLNETGISGTYSIKVTYTPTYRMGPPEEEQVTIFQGVQDLGLKLIAKQAPIEMLVVDHIEKPGAPDQ